MASLMLINPRKRGGGRKKARTPAQKAATRKLVAANRARRGGKRRKNPVGLERVENPRKRTISRRSRSRSGVRRRNPAPALRMGGKGMIDMGMASLQGAGGALFVNTALNYMPFLPPMLKSGNGKYLARAGLAVAVGVFGSKMLPGKIAVNAAQGALTVALHDLMLGIASQAMPTLQLGDVGDYDDGVSAYIDDQMSGYDDGYGMGDVYSQVGEYIE